MVIIAGEYGRGIAQGLARQGLGQLGEVTFKSFPNGEQRVVVGMPVSGERCLLVQSIATEPDRAFVQTLLLVDALIENGAAEVQLVVPFLGYSLQNRHFDGEPISARVVAKTLSASGVSKVYLVDIHSRDILQFFSVPVVEVSTRQLFIEYLKANLNPGWAIVSPDKGSTVRADGLIRATGAPIIRMEKHRDYTSGVIESLGIVEGSVPKVVVITDDIVNTGGTIERAAEILRKNGAEKIEFLATHFLGVPGSLERVLRGVDRLVTTNTVDHGLETSEKVVILDVSSAIATQLG